MSGPYDAIKDNLELLKSLEHLTEWIHPGTLCILGPSSAPEEQFCSWSCIQTITGSFMNYFCLVTKSCPTLCDPPTYCSLPGSSIHGIFWARILEWVAVSSSWGSSQLRDQTHVSCIGRQFFFFYNWATREAIYELALCILLNHMTSRRDNFLSGALRIPNPKCQPTTLQFPS